MEDKEYIAAPEHFINRELSWLEFNQRVLDEALDPSNPLLERVKFFSITSSNLDEFFEVRIAGLKQGIESDLSELSSDGMTVTECFKAVTQRVRKLVDQQFKCWRRDLAPALEEQGIQFLNPAKLKGDDREFAEKFYRDEVRPVLTPLGIDPAHPFPELLNKSLNIIVQLEVQQGSETIRRLAVVQVPRALERLVPLPRRDGSRHYVMLGHLIGHYLADLFSGNKVVGHWLFRVTRNSELYIDDEEVSNLLSAIEEELHNSHKNDAVRLEIGHTAPQEIREELLSNLKLTEEDLYVISGPINPVHLMALLHGDHSPKLRNRPFNPPIAAPFRDERDLFRVIRKQDVLIHHPYESFSSVVDFLAQAAEDPRVLAIKQTLYRTGGDPRIIGKLMNAVRKGKQVTAVVELRARFDEANNIEWARQLEEAGVHVVYGLVGYKIHAKMTLVVRKDPDGIRRYLHLGTGNYNPSTAKIYTDLSLFTCDPDFGEDAANVFNLLTGICQFQDTRKLLVAPFQFRDRMIELIDREADNASEGLPARIVAKMNSLVDPTTITSLYRASQAGVTIDLIVRGICCLRPGLKGVSDKIRVFSVVDRFLEHSRIYYFENACQPEVFLASGDWMPRNFDGRIEIIFPILDGNIRDRIISDLCDISLPDNVHSRQLTSSGKYVRVPPPNGDPEHRSQSEFMRLAKKSRPTTAKTGKQIKRGHLRMKIRSSPKG